jgi:hypothetical protein
LEAAAVPATCPIDRHKGGSDRTRPEQRRSLTFPATIRHNTIVLSAIFATSLNEQVTLLHPCRGGKTPTVPVKGDRIITPKPGSTAPP